MSADAADVAERRLNHSIPPYVLRTADTISPFKSNIALSMMNVFSKNHKFSNNKNSPFEHHKYKISIGHWIKKNIFGVF